MRVAGAVHQRIARLHFFAFLHVDMDAAWQRVFLLLAAGLHPMRFRLDHIGQNVDLAQALGSFAITNGSVDLRDHRWGAGLARFEQFDDARQSAGDVLGLRGRARGILRFRSVRLSESVVQF